MDFLIIATTSKLLLFLWLIRGTYGGLVQHVSATAVEGQNVSLQCILREELNITIIQMEWSKQPISNEKIEQKIVVFHSGLGPFYFTYDSFLKEETSLKTGKLLGSILTLYNVTVENSGNYVCDITSFPNGSIKKNIKLQVTDPPASVKMFASYDFYKEGDEVKITCSASPPPLQYKLKPSKNELFSNNSLNGEFILPNVTRKNSDLYICLPEWDSQELNRQGLNATMELTVNYLDIECNMSSSLNISVDEDVVISCIANASQNLLYKWMRGDETLSLSHTLALTSVKSEQSGTYKLTAVFQNKKLQINNEVYIHVLSKQSKVEEITTCLPLKTTEHQSSFTTLEMKSWSTSGATESETTTKSDPILPSTSKPNTTVTNAQPQNTIHHTALTGSSPAPPADTASTLHTSAVQSTDTQTNKTSTSPDLETRRLTVPSVTTPKDSTTTETAAKGSKSKAFVAVPFVLILLVLIVLLYRRYLNQEKMDRPPPFKPPPPPVKYTSVRNHDIRMTDILV